MSFVIETLKRSAAAAVRHARLFPYVRDSEWRRKRLLILCYHGISRGDEHEWNPGLYIPADVFRRRLELLLAHGCTVLPLASALEALFRGSLPDRSVVLTFDDGYYDFLAVAWPMLRACGYPATVYLPTLRCEHNKPAFPLMVSYLLWKRRGQVVDAADRGLPLERLDLRTGDGRQAACRAFVDHARRGGLSKVGKDDLAVALAEALDIDHAALLASRTLTLMNPGEVADLAAQGVDFELHTHTHQTPPDRARCMEEISKNREKLVEMTGSVPAHFCYPSGVYRREMLAWLSEAGVASATTCDPGLATRASNPLLLNRFVDTCRVTELEFETWVTGCAGLLPHRRAAILREGNAS